MSILKRAATGLIAGLPVGLILYVVCGLVNAAAQITVVEPMIGLAIGVATSVGLQFVKDMKEDEKK